jgi:hypothetical protein
MTAVLLILLTASLQGKVLGWTFGFSSAAYMDDNVYKNYTRYNDIITAAQGSMYHDVLSHVGNFRIHYEGAASLYKKYDDRNILHHTLGVVWTLPLGTENRVLNAGGNGFIGNYRGIYAIFDYRSIQGFISIR